MSERKISNVEKSKLALDKFRRKILTHFKTKIWNGFVSNSVERFISQKHWIKLDLMSHTPEAPRQCVIRTICIHITVRNRKTIVDYTKSGGAYNTNTHIQAQRIEFVINQTHTHRRTPWKLVSQNWVAHYI